MSKQWENDIAREIWHADPPYVRAYRAGFSGSGAMPQPDVHVFDNSTGMAHDMELKGPIAGDTVKIDADDANQLDACRSNMTRAYLVIKFQNRAPIVIPLMDIQGDDEDREPLEQLRFIANEMYPFLAPRIPGEYLYLDKPDVDNEAEDGWPSARSSRDDFREILRGIGIHTVD